MATFSFRLDFKHEAFSKSLINHDLLASKALGATSVLFYYVDDLLLGSDTVTEHLGALDIMFEELSRDNWRINGGKSKWCCESVEYFGIELCPEGILSSNRLLRKLNERCTVNGKTFQGTRSGCRRATTTFTVLRHNHNYK